VAGGAPGHIAALLVAFAQGNDALSKLVHAIFGDCGGAEPALLEAQRELLSGYDVTHISRIATICHWGRSGSVLIASFLDGHDDVLILPNQLSESIYPFLGRYASLTLWQKLLAYPAYSRQQKTPSGEFFLTIDPHCDYAIAPADYLVAVMALHREYGDFPPEVLGSDAAFFRFLHVAYALVLGRRAGNPRPIMVVAQHWWNEQLAARLCGDFPGALFLHTIRDPISAFDAWLDMHFQWQLGGDAALSRGYPYPVFDAWRDLLSWDHAHRGVAARSRAVRFEDMHNEPEALMQRVARWLQIGVQPSLVESTLNGKPYVVMIKGQAVVGSDPQRAGRRAGNLSALDRLLIFALLHHNFVAWRYPSPPAMRSTLLRGLIILAGSVVPSRREIANIRLLLRRQFLPALRAGRLGYAAGTWVVIATRRARIMALLLRAGASRLSANHQLLEVV
jgi:hypothetical protein